MFGIRKSSIVKLVLGFVIFVIGVLLIGAGQSGGL